jgi:hypothetical protein
MSDPNLTSPHESPHAEVHGSTIGEDPVDEWFVTADPMNLVLRNDVSRLYNLGYVREDDLVRLNLPAQVNASDPALSAAIRKFQADEQDKPGWPAGKSAVDGIWGPKTSAQIDVAYARAVGASKGGVVYPPSYDPSLPVAPPPAPPWTPPPAAPAAAPPTPAVQAALDRELDRESTSSSNLPLIVLGLGAVGATLYWARKFLPV